MLTASRALALNAQAAPLLPQPRSLGPLWDWGCKPRQGQLIMIAGRPGSQKSGFALFWVAQMGLPALYFSADMTPFEATSRLVSMTTGETTEEVEDNWGTRSDDYIQALKGAPIQFSFGSPITWQGVADELEAYMELYNSLPSILVFDNLMDIEGCETDYQAQSAAMQDLTTLSRETGCTVIVIHHATDKSSEAQVDPGKPPARREIKNGLAEKPQLTLTVALEPTFNEFRIAVVKQRGGRGDAAGMDFVRLQAFPELTRFAPRQRNVA